MKKNILLALCCCSLLAFTGCSDDYTDATSKHIYGENENPYLKTNTNAQVTTNVALEVNGRHAYVLNLSDYTDKFEELMGMSVDAAVAGLDTKATVFYPINMTRNQWLKTAYTKDGAGWYFNSVGQPCSADDADGKATVTLDKVAKTLNVELTEGGIVAGTVFTLNVGFAVNGPDYDDYVRFTFEVGVTDPTVSVVSVAFSSDNATVTIIFLEILARIVSRISVCSYSSKLLFVIPISRAVYIFKPFSIIPIEPMRPRRSSAFDDISPFLHLVCSSRNTSASSFAPASRIAG